MKYFNEDNVQIDESTVDLNQGWIREEKRLVAHHDATPEVQQVSHWQDVLKDGVVIGQTEIIDQPYQPAKDAWDEYEWVGVYVPFTDDELEARAEREIEFNRGKALDEQVGLAVMMLVESQADVLSDDQAKRLDAVFPEFDETKQYRKGVVVRDNGLLWRAINNVNASTVHPSDDEADWRRLDEPNEDGVFPWRQPYGKKDYYRKNDLVTHDGSTWVSDVNKNTWEPGVYGWHKQDDAGTSDGGSDAGSYEPDAEWPAYVQPTSKDSYYDKGAHVTFNGRHYECLKNNVSLSPADSPSDWMLVD